MTISQQRKARNKDKWLVRHLNHLVSHLKKNWKWCSSRYSIKYQWGEHCHTHATMVSSLTPVGKTQQRKKSIWQFSQWTRTHQFSIKFLQMGLRNTFRRLNTMTEFISFQVNFKICKSASIVQQTNSIHNNLSSYRIGLCYYSFLWIFVWTGKHAHRGQKRYQIPLSLSYRHLQDAQFAIWVLGFGSS